MIAIIAITATQIGTIAHNSFGSISIFIFLFVFVNFFYCLELWPPTDIPTPPTKGVVYVAFMAE